MRSLRYLLLILAAPGIVGCAHGQAVARFSLTMRAPREMVSLGAPVPVEIALTNTSNQELLDLGNSPPEFSFNVSVTNAQGIPVPLSDFGRALKGEGTGGGVGFTGGGIGPVRPGYGMKPGSSRKFEILVNSLYELTQPGTYRIQVTRNDPQNNALVKSNTIAVTVAGADQWRQHVERLPKPFGLRIATDDKTIKTGSSLLLRISVTNGLPEDLVLDNAATKYDVKVWDSEGNLAPLTPAGRDIQRHVGAGGGPRFTVHPGEDIPADLRIDKQYDLSRPGKYTIQVTRATEQTHVVISSNTITVTVTP